MPHAAPAPMPRLIPVGTLAKQGIFDAEALTTLEKALSMVEDVEPNQLNWLLIGELMHPAIWPDDCLGTDLLAHNYVWEFTIGDSSMAMLAWADDIGMFQKLRVLRELWKNGLVPIFEATNHDGDYHLADVRDTAWFRNLMTN